MSCTFPIASDLHRSVYERFVAKVEIVDDDTSCWTWSGTRAPPMHYGVLWVPGAQGSVGAHRVALEMATGTPIPDGMCVLHSCDNPPCVRPDHLRVGTHSENTRDMIARRRGRVNRQRGEANASHRLTEEQVRSMIADAPSMSRRALAAKYSVHPAYACLVLLGKRWGHIERPVDLRRHFSRRAA